MRKLFVACCLIFLFCSCASLTKTQLTAVNQFAKTSENFSYYPSKILEELAGVRMNSGVYFANSLGDARLHLKELDDIYDFKRNDVQLSKKADVTFKIIDQYARALVLLSSGKYESGVNTQSQALEVNLDSMITLYNSIGDAQKIPARLGSELGKLSATGGVLYIRWKQAREIKKYVVLADTLIAVMTNNLIEFLQAGNLSELIENERTGVGRNYLSYLRQISTLSSIAAKKDTAQVITGTKSTLENDRGYLHLKATVDAVADLRDATIAATRKLRKSHGKLKELVSERRTLKTSLQEIQDFYTEVGKLKFIVTRLEKLKQ